MNENLVGYLLGSLDSVTHRRVELYLEANPEAQERLQLLEQALAPLAEDTEEPDPPRHLVMNTLARVAEHRTQKLPTAPAATSHQVGAPPRRRFRLIDWVVAAAVLFLACGVALPFGLHMWQHQDRAACANNLRKFWVALAEYGDAGTGEFPRVEATGSRAVAGIFVPMLNDRGLALDVSVQCPSRGIREPFRYSVAELDTLHVNAPEEYRAVSRELAGNYAYTLGYRDGPRLYGLRRDSGDGLPILADGSSGVGNSANHAGNGQNVLFVGGNIRWAVEPTVGLECDNIYVNHHNRVQAGISRIDSVLGNSDSRPFSGN